MTVACRYCAACGARPTEPCRSERQGPVFGFTQMVENAAAPVTAMLMARTTGSYRRLAVTV